MKFQERGNSLLLWCPACEELHRISDSWTWGGAPDLLNVHPSIKVGGVQWPENDPFHKPQHTAEAGQSICCHSFVRDGYWEFLSDCTHTLAGQTVPMVDLPDWLVAE